MRTYGYISMIAMICYGFMFLTFLAAKKDKLVNSFLIVLVGLLFWTGGSVLMRLEFWPGYVFWFQVSLLGILLLPYAYYQFINAYGGVQERWFGIGYLVIMTICFVINLPGGMLLKYPELVERNGVQYFEYSVKPAVGVLFFVAGVMIIHMLANVVRMCRKSTAMRRQYELLIVGIAVLFVGNLAIGLPFFTGFPIDILCGLINAFILMYALIRRRLFRLRLLASGGLCYGIGLLLSLVLFVHYSPEIEKLLQQHLPSMAGYYPLFFGVLFLLMYLVFTFIWKSVINTVFIKDEVFQTEKLKTFSSTFSKTLHLQEIMDETIQVIKATLDVESIYICIQEIAGSAYRCLYSDMPLNDLSFALEVENPIVQWLTGNDEPLNYREFCYTVEYKSMWENEKYQLEKMGVRCCAGLKDDNQLIGIIILAGNNPKKNLGYDDIQMLSSITSVCSIAIKNARLYERAYKEARRDELTGLLNRKCFYEILNEEFEKNAEGSLALILLNVDDFKLYNQLYGVKEGDNCLRRIAEVIRSSVGDNGFAARYGGKEFAILLPRYDIFSARNVAESVCKQIYEMNSQELNFKLKPVTLSVGVSASPYAAKTAKELMDSVDMAVYHVKHSGKNGIQVFDTLF